MLWGDHTRGTETLELVEPAAAAEPGWVVPADTVCRSEKGSEYPSIAAQCGLHHGTGLGIDDVNGGRGCAVKE